MNRISYLMPTQELWAAFKQFFPSNVHPLLDVRYEEIMTKCFGLAVRGGWLPGEESIEGLNVGTEIVERAESFMLCALQELFELYISEDYDTWCLTLDAIDELEMEVSLDTDYANHIHNAGRYG